jgi:NAD(P)H-nitrite reductase large subunit
VDVRLERKATSLDPGAKTVVDDKGTTYTYDKLLLATGGIPRRLPFGDGDLIYFRTLDDYYSLKGLTERRHRIAVIGGGFIGSEIAAALAGADQEVQMFQKLVSGVSFLVTSHNFSTIITGNMAWTCAQVRWSAV